MVSGRLVECHIENECVIFSNLDGVFDVFQFCFCSNFVFAVFWFQFLSRRFPDAI